MTEILRIESLCKSFGALAAVNSVSFSVEHGEVFGIAGPNGSGKSTLFNLMTGIPYFANSGRVLFHGRQIERLPPHEICRLGIARTFQRNVEFPMLTVVENVVIGAAFGRTPASQRIGPSQSGLDNLALRALDRVGIPRAFSARRAGTMSVFNKKRMMIASALATDPVVLLLDEPASGLTPPEIEGLVALVTELNRDGITLVLIEHVLPLLLTVSHRLMVLNQGQVLVAGLPHDVVRDDRVIEAYLGRRGRDALAA